MGPHALIGSFSHGPEAVFYTFLMVFGFPVMALWLIGQIPMCGFAERWAYGLLRLYGQVLSWPFRWLGRQIRAAANQAVRAFERLMVSMARATGRGTWRLVRWASRQLWRGLRWSWREIVYRTRRAYHGRNWRP